MGVVKVSENQMEGFYEGLRKLMDLAEEDRFQLTYTLREGDLVAFDNRRVLHSRTAYTEPEAGMRRLQGCYLDRDEFNNRYRSLSRSLSRPSFIRPSL